jgi:hypothetical protein
MVADGIHNSVRRSFRFLPELFDWLSPNPPQSITSSYLARVFAAKFFSPCDLTQARGMMRPIDGLE